MIQKHRKPLYNNILFKTLKIVFFIAAAYLALNLGIIGGEVLSRFDTRLVAFIGVDSFKGALNKSLPIIDTVYNSGQTSFSLPEEIKKVVGGIFGIDLNNPVTVINAQSPYLYCFYNDSYLPYIIQRDKAGNIEYEALGGDDTGSGEKQDEKGQVTTIYKEAASSTSYPGEGDTEGKSKDNTVSSGRILISNETGFKIDNNLIEKLINEPLKFKFDKRGREVLVYHTHTTESYIDSIKYLNRKDIPSFSSNESKNVVRVGEAIADYLKDKGIGVIHNSAIHDTKPREAAYGRAIKTVNTILKNYTSVKVVLDIHRDGADGGKLRPVIDINGKKAAQIMFVIGTNGTGLKHPNWRENLKFALKLQKRLNEICPGLARPITIDNNRYNQHVKYGALIIEVGGDGNTLKEALESTRYVTRAVYDVVNGTGQ